MSQNAKRYSEFWLLAPEFSGLGAVAQLGERLICTQEVAGSIPTSSTSVGTAVNNRWARSSDG